MHDFERGQAAIEQLSLANTEHEMNEATTRRSIIDTLLRDVFAWPNDQVICEEYIDGDYLDYRLGSPLGRGILEAKKTGLTFEAPVGTESGWTTVEAFRGHSRRNREAIDQVLKYCQRAGVGVALLSNGYQLLAFLGSRADGQKPTTGRALFYSSLDAVRVDFHQAWDLLSFKGMEGGELARRLAHKSTVPPPPPPLSSRINSYPGFRIGSEMETDLRILGDLFIQDVAREESVSDEFLTECYCSSGALSQYAAVSREILRTRYQALESQVNTEPARDKRGANRNLLDDVIAGAITRRPIILLGDVGVGKSIFLKHLFRVESRDMLDKTVVFYVDFLKHSGLIDEAPKLIEQSVANELRVNHQIDINERQFVRSVYNKELNAFKRGIYGELSEAAPAEYRRHEIEMLSAHMENSYEHTRRSLEHLRSSRGLNFVVVLDNVDQHQAPFQEQIFIAGQALADTWPSAVFMSLRPDTFHESRKTGALAAYQPRVFTVSPPRSDQVVLKRLEFARKELIKFSRLPGFPSGLTLDSESLLVYIDVLIDAFRNNEQLIELIDNLSSGNTRRALDFVSTFVGSGYVQTSRILEAHRSGRPYVVPIHEFIRAILYGDHKYYDPNTSPVPNLFAVSSSDAREHFLLPNLLASVQAAGEREHGGFVEMRTCAAELQTLGYSVGQIDFHITRGVRHGLLETTGFGESAQMVRITPAGGYLHSKLVCSFAYVDAVVVDTPILDAAVRPTIRDVFDINDRVDRAAVFVSYLDRCWPFGDELTPFSWPFIRQEWSASLESVKRGAARAAERRARR